MVLSIPGRTSNGRTAGVGSLFRKPKCAVSPAMPGLLFGLEYVAQFIRLCRSNDKRR
jgi:hypothetical protein